MAEKFKLDIVKLESAAAKLRAMAHPMRIAIVNLLHEKKKLNVTDIYKTLKIEQAAASHHLNILKSKGVLVSRRSGKQILYSLPDDALQNMVACIDMCIQNAQH